MLFPVKGVSILACLHLLPLFLTLVYGIQGATLREHRLREPGSYEPGFQLRPPPSAEMLRALRYIQSLSQGTLSKPPADNQQPVDTDLEPDDMESVRSMLRLAAPAQGSMATERDLEEREDDNNKAQQWLQAVLTTLQQTEEQTVPQKMSRKVTGHTSSPPHPHYPIQPRPKQQLEVETSSAENYERSTWGNPSNQRRHRQYPLIFENEEDQEQPLKRTNENAEEQYTPQKLATLQSVFEELSGISTAKTNSKRESAVASSEDDDDLYRQRKMALEDILGTNEWEPSEEQTEIEEEQRERHGFDDDDEVKRSNQPDLFTTEKEDSEDIAKLVNLLKLLESKEQKREDVNDMEQEEQETYREVEKKDANEEDEEEENEERDEEEREIKSMHKTFPQTLSQLITMSQKLQIPPADVLDLLQNNLKDFRIPAQSRTPQRTYTPHQRPLQTLQRNRVTQDILSILELVSAAQQNDKLPQRPSQTKPSRYYEKERDLPSYGFLEPSRDDYDDTTGEEDELTSFLASEMLAPRHAHLRPALEQRSIYGTLERAVQDYLDKNSAEKRPVERKSTATSLDDNTMMRILKYLEPESDDETDSESKTIPEM
ncbi:secretogranin-2a [Triplophysa rosa]|uniref:Secretogranin II n=1 Tax=Triplophysa rosa TaxID=992332 RepID=A0A9W7W965_TRIRA|nr:secretogranin-2a [Triplophysa rosa]KAI7790069.1 secretogranin II precursor [Triplophysa rosa]